MKDPLVLGFLLVAVDVAVWRSGLPRNEAARLFVRLIVFGLLSAVLFSSGLSPFGVAPWPESAPRHVGGQVLEIIWWLAGARLLTLVLDTLLLPRSWRRQRLFQDVFGAVVFLAAVVASLAFVLELPVRGLVATSGALAIVLGLAIQSTLSDVFAGIVINTTEPYQIGNWVIIDGVEGKVLEMNWRATHLLTAHGNIVIVPNAVAAKTKITNNSRPPLLHGVSVMLEISPQERPATVLAALERALAGAMSLMATPPPYAQVKKATASSIQYEAIAYIDDMARKVQVTNELYDLSYRHLAAAGIDLRPLGLPAVPPIEADPRARLLARVDLFAVLPRDELQKLAGRMSRHEYEPGEVVLAAGSVTDCLTIVESGVLSVMVDGSEGEVEVARLGPGEAIGESGVLAGLPVRATITTITRAVTWQLDKTDLTPLLKSQPALARQMCQMLSQRQDRLGKLGAVAPPAGDTQHTIFQWLWDGMRKLHDLAT